MRKDLQNILNKIKNDNAFEAKKLFNSIPIEDSIDYHLVNAKLEQKFQNWGKAMNAYNKILDIDSNHKEAKDNLTHLNDILNFSHSGSMNV